AAAKDGLITPGAPGKPDARSEVMQRGRLLRAPGDDMDRADGIHRADLCQRVLRDDHVASGGIPVVDETIAEVARAEVIPAEPEVERKALGNLEGVLDEEAELAIVLGAADEGVESRALERDAEEEIGIAEAGVGAV